MPDLTHFDASGRAQMVDVGAKEATRRLAVARICVRMQRETIALVAGGAARKGDVIGIARIAGIMAAKRTAELIPLCHPVPLTHVAIDAVIDDALPGIRIEALAQTTGQTGVEMEALTAASVAALTIYDMLKAADRGMVIDGLHLARKEGGASGTFRAAP